MCDLFKFMQELNIKKMIEFNHLISETFCSDKFCVLKTVHVFRV